MAETSPPAPPDRWTLVRRARQLITLHGAGGPRRGLALSDIGVLSDGALLIRNGVVEEYGPSRRVENLANARKAREIDASHCIVLPAFVDPDAVLAYPRYASRRLSEHPRETPIRLFSKRRLEGAVALAAADCVRHGVLTVAAHTGYAFDLRDTVKVLRAQQTLQGKPVRIRSVLSPRNPEPVEDKWLAVARQKKLAVMLDIPGATSLQEFDATASLGASRGFGLRIRAPGGVSAAVLKAAIPAGVAAVISPPTYDNASLAALSTMGAVHVINADPGTDYSGAMRHEIERGMAVALSSGYRIEGVTSANPQFILYLATTRLGMTLPEAITALTWNAACALRVSQVAGSLEPGKPADLIIVDIPDYRDLARRSGHNDVKAVMRQGRTVYRRAGLILD